MNIIKKIVAVLDENQKNKALILLILIFFSTFLEILSIGIILPILHVLAKGKTYLVELIQNRVAIFSNFLEPLENIEYSTLTIYIILFLTGLFLFKFLFVIFTIWKNASFLAQVDNELSKRMFNLYIKQKYSFHMDNRSSKLLNNLLEILGCSGLMLSIIAFVFSNTFACASSV